MSNFTRFFEGLGLRSHESVKPMVGKVAFFDEELGLGVIRPEGKETGGVVFTPAGVEGALEIKEGVELKVTYEIEPQDVTNRFTGEVVGVTKRAVHIKPAV